MLVTTNFIHNLFTFSEDQQALEDEGIVLTMKPTIPMSMQNRAHNMLQHPAAIPLFNANQMVAMAGSQAAISYTPQNYFGHHAIATPGFIANNFPSSNNMLGNEPTSRRKSIIENINPLVSEQKILPTDLSMFPVRFFSNFHFFFGRIYLEFLFLGGLTACTFIKTIGWWSFGIIERNRRTRTGF